MPSSAASSLQCHPLSLHDALPISPDGPGRHVPMPSTHPAGVQGDLQRVELGRLGGRPLQRGGAVELEPHACRPALVDPPSVRDALRSEEHTSELQSPCNLVCRLLLPAPCSATLFPYTTLFRSHRTVPAVMSQCQVPIRPASRAICNVSSSVGWAAGPSSVEERSSSNHTRVGPPSSIPHRSATRSDRKSTRLNSSHLVISYAVFCCQLPAVPPSFPTRRSSDLTGRSRPSCPNAKYPSGRRPGRSATCRARSAGRPAPPAWRSGRARTTRVSARPRRSPIGPRRAQIGRAHV